MEKPVPEGEYEILVARLYGLLLPRHVSLVLFIPPSSLFSLRQCFSSYSPLPHVYTLYPTNHGLSSVPFSFLLPPFTLATISFCYILYYRPRYSFSVSINFSLVISTRPFTVPFNIYSYPLSSPPICPRVFLIFFALTMSFFPVFFHFPCISARSPFLLLSAPYSIFLSVLRSRSILPLLFLNSRSF